MIINLFSIMYSITIIYQLSPCVRRYCNTQNLKDSELNVYFYMKITPIYGKRKCNMPRHLNSFLKGFMFILIMNKCAGGQVYMSAGEARRFESPWS